ncbi:hypothetical protein L596_026251 [Steinernema carpocapsae]|uniref:Uncharacterized protein n=1 Tax=Steinernema carpocapsae TaxID=34508 RepID=A0A4U5M0T2_STECR|nr:hypothetical protein L596_026251 [Steinernema carpocapsae]
MEQVDLAVPEQAGGGYRYRIKLRFCISRLRRSQKTIMKMSKPELKMFQEASPSLLSCCLSEAASILLFPLPYAFGAKARGHELHAAMATATIMATEHGHGQRTIHGPWPSECMVMN